MEKYGSIGLKRPHKKFFCNGFSNIAQNSDQFWMYVYGYVECKMYYSVTNDLLSCKCIMNERLFIQLS